jgi:peptidoglycan/LPS O-acetylase OafA/YrhL
MRQSSHHVLSLDLFRGLAAICVMFYHITFLFSETAHIFARGYLCVDFFFLLSGYVISKSYDKKIADGLGFKPFFVLRIARLWPLVLLTTILGFALQLIRFHRNIPDLSYWDLAVSLAVNLIMVPSPKSPNGILFPFNAAAWSIFFELVANIIYVLAFRYLIGIVLGITIVGSALALTWTAMALNSLDVGMTQGNFIFGFPRVLFSFFLGLLIFRHRDDLWRWPIYGAWPILVGLVAVGALLNIPHIPIDRVNGLIDLFAVVVVFPLLLRVAEGAELPARLNRVAWFLGGISYSVYLLQTPLTIGFSALPQVFWGQKIAALAPWAGMLFSLILPPIAYICWKYFERPAQRWLTKTLLKDEAGAQPSVANRGSMDRDKQYVSDRLRS